MYFVSNHTAWLYFANIHYQRTIITLDSLAFDGMGRAKEQFQNDALYLAHLSDWLNLILSEHSFETTLK